MVTTNLSFYAKAVINVSGMNKLTFSHLYLTTNSNFTTKISGLGK